MHEGLKIYKLARVFVIKSPDALLNKRSVRRSLNTLNPGAFFFFFRYKRSTGHFFPPKPSFVCIENLMYPFLFCNLWNIFRKRPRCFMIRRRRFSLHSYAMNCKNAFWIFSLLATKFGLTFSMFFMTSVNLECSLLNDILPSNGILFWQQSSIQMLSAFSIFSKGLFWVLIKINYCWQSGSD